MFRLYHILYDRLLSIKRLCSKAQRQRRRVAHPVERAGSSSAASGEDRGEEDYRTFLGALTALLDGTLENSKFEDECRNLVGTSSSSLASSSACVWAPEARPPPTATE